MLDAALELESWHGETDFQGLTNWKAFNEGDVLQIEGKRPLLPRFNSLPQMQLISSTAAFPAFVGGFGSGKSAGLVRRTIANKRRYPTCNVAFYEPTFDLVRNIAIPYFEEELDAIKLPYRLNKSTAEIEVRDCGRIIFRTMENPKRIIGYEVADSGVDELDTLKIEDARNVWNKIMARNRQKKPDGAINTVAVGTTPEGFKFVYEKWEKELQERLQKNESSLGYQLIRATTYSNQRNLPADYIQRLYENYPPALVAAYIMGKFVNLQGGTIYTSFDRKLNHVDAEIQADEPLHIGMDFNVTNMSAIVHVIRDGVPAALAEITKVYDTPAMIKAIEARWPNHRVKFIYPDASGDSRKSVDASKTDLSLLAVADQKLGKPVYGIMVNSTNPSVKDRVLSMNTAFCNGAGRRLYKVNTRACPTYTNHLEQQIWDEKGEPDKKSGHDHTNDAGGYFIAKRFPVIKPNAHLARISGT